MNAEGQKKYIHEKLAALGSIFTMASRGDFSHDVQIPEGEDEFTELYAGVQIIIGVVRERMKEEEEIKASLEKNLEDLKIARAYIGKEKAEVEAILTSVGDGLIVTDQSGKVTMLNQQAENMLGCKSKDAIGKDWFEILKIEAEKNPDQSISASPFQVALTSGEKVTATASDDYYCVRRNTTKFPIAITASPITSDGVIEGVIAVFRNITQEKELDRAKSEFIALASHQLLSPPTIIKSYADMLLEGDVGKLAGKQKDYVETIQEANQNIIDLVRALLNVSRMEFGTFTVEPESVHVADIMKDVVNEFKPQIKEKRLVVEEDYDKEIPMIKLDPRLIRIVFQNLVSNAVRYTPNSGKIGITISIAEEKPSSPAQKKQGAVKIIVQDTGYGIPKEQQQKIFTKLFRADNARQKVPDGTGLGLYLAKSIIDHAKGNLWFESEEDKGTVFYITIPFAGMERKEGTTRLK